MMGGDAFRLGR